MIDMPQLTPEDRTNRGHESAEAPVITLMHGTFAYQARWTRAGSLLRKDLASLFGPSIVYAAFRWGRFNNTRRARRRAVARLQAHIRTVATAYPDRRHFIIAHSHAGNVARLATSDPTMKSLVSGVVCLSTPFIHIQPRALWSAVQIGLPLMTVFAVAAVVNRLLEPTVARILGDSWSPSVAWLAALTGAIAVYPMKMALDWAHRQVDEANTRTHTTPLLIIRTTGDEASGALVTAAFADYLLTFGLAIVCLPFSAVVAVVFAALILIGVLFRLSDNTVQSLLVTLLTVAAANVPRTVVDWVLRALLTAGFLLAVTAALRWLSGVGYGLTSLFVEVTSESTPCGEWTMHLIQSNRGWPLSADWYAEGSTWETWLTHSATYNNRQAIALIADWIKERSSVVGSGLDLRASV